MNASSQERIEDKRVDDERVDIVIAGGGYVGLGLALALKTADPTLDILVADIRPTAAIARDERASAIVDAGRALLDRLGVWDEIAPHAQPIESMIVTDSRLRDAARPVFLTFAQGPKANGPEGVETAEPDRPFAHMVPNSAMVGALAKAATEAGIAIEAPQAVEDFTDEGSAMAVHLADGRTVRATLLVAADGVRSKLRDLAGIRTVRWDYGQAGIVTTVSHERPHNGRAEEHFLPSGPFAILPLTGNRSSLVWTEKRDEAERLVKEDDFVFQLELERRFGKHLGTVKVAGPRFAYPLGLTLARDWIRPRFALAGDSAHGIHPISGQGLNMGFRDIAALAETIIDARRLGLDFGAVDILQRYERWRRFDTWQMGVVTDVLNRLFSNDIDAVRLVRDVGLGIVDRMPWLKRLFMEEAKGAAGDSPKLLRGEAL